MRSLRFLTALCSLLLLSCAAAGSPPDAATATPDEPTEETGSPTARFTEETATPSPTPSPTPTPEFDPDDLAPIGAYEVITLGAEATLHLWVEFSEDCLQVGETAVRREGFTIEVTVLMVRPEDADCEQGWFPAEVSIPLDTTGLAAGTYTIEVNNGRNSLAWEYSAATPAPPAGCPTPTADTVVYVSQAQDFCVLMPAGWHALASGYRSPFLTGGSEPVIVGLTFQADSPAEGRTVDQVVDQSLSSILSDPSLNLVRTEFELDGERMVRVEGIPARAEEYQWWAIHNDTVYLGVLAFRSIGPAAPHFDRAFDLFIRTLHWLS